MAEAGHVSPRRTGIAFGIAIIFAVIAGLLGFVVLVAADRHFLGHETPAAPEILAAAILASALVLPIWVLLYFLHVRRRAPERGRRHLTILLLSVLGPNLALAGLVILGERNNARIRDREAKQETAGAIAEIRTAILRSTDPEGFSVQVHSRSAGEAGIIGRATKAYLRSITDDNERAYQDELLIKNAWSSKPIRDDADFVRANAAVSGEASNLRAYWIHRTQHLSQYRGSLVMGALDQATKQAALATFDRAVADSAPYLKQRQSLEVSVLLAMRTATDLAAKTMALKRNGASGPQLMSAITLTELQFKKAAYELSLEEAYRQGLSAPRE